VNSLSFYPYFMLKGPVMNPRDVKENIRAYLLKVDKERSPKGIKKAR